MLIHKNQIYSYNDSIEKKPIFNKKVELFRHKFDQGTSNRKTHELCGAIKKKEIITKKMEETQVRNQWTSLQKTLWSSFGVGK